MAPADKRRWFPLLPLGAAFLLLVLAGNFLFHAVRVPDRHRSASIWTGDYLQKKRRRVEQKIRAIQWWFEASFKGYSLPPSPKRSGKSGGARVEEPAEVAAFLTPSGSFLPDVSSLSLDYLKLAPASIPTKADPKPAPFSYFPAEIQRFGMKYDPRDERIRVMQRSQQALLEEGADFALRIPEALIDGFISMGRGAFPRQDVYSAMEDRDSSLVMQWLSFERASPGRTPSLLRGLAANVMEREQRFFGGFADSYLNTPGFEDRSEEISGADLVLEQERLLLDAAKKTYTSLYRVDRTDERFREGMWTLDRWSGMDFVLLPPLSAVYLYHRGIDRRLSFAGTKFRIHVDSLRQVRTRFLREWSLPFVAWLEWGIPDFPIKLIGGMGLDSEGDPRLDFIGIGTGIGEGRKIWALQN